FRARSEFPLMKRSASNGAGTHVDGDATTMWHPFSALLKYDAVHFSEIEIAVEIRFGHRRGTPIQKFPIAERGASLYPMPGDIRSVWE
ncbi:hypothetical protein C1X83_36805, partial [Pseudomonas sp. GP01-A4]